MLCAVLGVPHSNLPVFKSAAEGPFDLTASTETETLTRQVRLVDYMSKLVARRRQESADDLLDDLI